jgi:hypothetical protein
MPLHGRRPARQQSNDQKMTSFPLKKSTKIDAQTMHRTKPSFDVVPRSSLITSFTSPSLVFFRHASFVLSRNSSAIPCLRPALLGKKMPALCSKIGYETASRVFREN